MPTLYTRAQARIYAEVWSAIDRTLSPAQREQYAKHKPGHGQGDLFDSPSDPEFEAKHPREGDGTFAPKGEGETKPAAAETKAPDPETPKPPRIDFTNTNTGQPSPAVKLYLTRKEPPDAATVATMFEIVPPAEHDELAQAIRAAHPTASDHVDAAFKPAPKPEPPAAAPAPVEAKAEESKARDAARIQEAITTRKIADFGQTIEGARKMTAKPVGPRAKKDKPKSDRPGWAHRYEVSRIDKSSRPEEEGKYAIYDNKDKNPWGHPRQKGQLYDSAEAAEAALPLVEVARNHGVSKISRSGEPDNYAIVRTVGPRKHPVVKDGFASYEDAMRHMAANPHEVIEHQFPRYETYQYLDHVERKGPDVRKGDIKPEDFQKAFNFYGGQFGNWVNDKESQTSLNHAYEALHDLADVTGLPPRAMALNGELGIAFGARGTGGKDAARAHYEPDKKVINLTKMKGAGTLAHEWAHALDAYIGSVGGAKDHSHGISETGYHNTRQQRPEVVEAAKHLVNTMMATEEERAVSHEIETKGAARYGEALQKHMKELANRIDSERRYKNRPPLTDAQKKTWQDAADKILSGDVGEAKFIPGPHSRMGGYQSYEALDKLNKLFKEYTGRSFHTSTKGSVGAEIYWSLKLLKNADQRVELANAGATEKRKRQSNYLRESARMDLTRGSDYYTLPHEMLARAFEAYVQDRLEAKDRKSEYLAARAHNKHYQLVGLKPFPEDAEREAINAAFDKLFAAIKHESRSDDRGDHVRLYSRKPAAGQHSLWNEADHPRGQPDNAGQFGSKGGGTATLDPPAKKQPPKKPATTPKGAPRDEQKPAEAKPGQTANAHQQAQQATPEFKNWFAGSVVTNPDGSPRLMYHGSRNTSFNEFRTMQSLDLGSHFGTVDQADDFTVGIDGDQPGVFQVYLSVKNPLRMKDRGAWFWDDMLEQLEAAGVPVPDDIHEQHFDAQEALEAADPKNRRDRSNLKQWENETLRGLMEAAGYDGIVYLNDAEGLDNARKHAVLKERGYSHPLTDDELRAMGAEDSYVCLRPTQIKSATGNAGSFDGANPDIRYARTGLVERFSQAFAERGLG